MLYMRNLGEEILKPFSGIADELVIISGYVGASQVEKAIKLGLKLRILYGMAGNSGVSFPNHKIFTELTKNNKNLDIRYTLKGNEVHSKIYVWRHNGKIVRALMGSANFTNQGLNIDNKEILIDVHPEEWSHLQAYIDIVLSSDRTESCTDHVKTEITTIPKTTRELGEDIVVERKGAEVKTIRLKLSVAEKSGLNWGHASAHVSSDDAYIAIPVAAIKTGFFEPKPAEKVPIEVIWDDGEVMNMLEEGSQPYNDVKYPKQLGSDDSKRILGQYLRKRLGVPFGEKVTRKHLDDYGKDYVDVTRTAPGNYYIDFSNPEE